MKRTCTTVLHDSTTTTQSMNVVPQTESSIIRQHNEYLSHVCICIYSDHTLTSRQAATDEDFGKRQRLKSRDRHRLQLNTQAVTTRTMQLLTSFSESNVLVHCFFEAVTLIRKYQKTLP